MIIGESLAIQRSIRLAERFAPSRVPILLVGARGTGKELLAHHIHTLSGRRGDFVDVNCGAVPRELAESLLFGHDRGAFTDARAPHIGWLEESNGGTLFLDEFGDLPPECQVKVLRALESEEIRPLGQRGKRRLDLRIIAAVQHDVWGRAAAGTLRADLVDRVAVGVIELPPLAKRGSDTIILATHFAQKQGQELEPGVAGVLLNHSWPGNVRELRAVIARAGCLVDNGTLSPSAVAEAIEMGTGADGAPRRGSDTRGRLPRTLGEWVKLGAEHGWQAAQMAIAVGVGRTTLFARLKQQGHSLRMLREFGSSP